MSAEAFQTPMTADVATATDGVGLLVGRPGENWPRAFTNEGQRSAGSWVSCYLNVEPALRVCAESVRTQEMTGLTGDHALKRQLTSDLLHAAADLVRELALDHAYDLSLGDDRWAERLAEIARIANSEPAVVVTDRRWGSVRIHES